MLENGQFPLRLPMFPLLYAHPMALLARLLLDVCQFDILFGVFACERDDVRASRDLAARDRCGLAGAGEPTSPRPARGGCQCALRAIRCNAPVQ